MIGAYPLDGWTPIHLMLGAGAAMIVRSLGGTRWTAFGAAVLVCVAWEVLDAAFAGQWFFDGRGADVTDILVGAVGAGLTARIIK
jgi:VanZ family protein